MTGPVDVDVEVPRGSFVKRDQQGKLDLASPLPSPFNYGSIAGTKAPDGEPEDAVVIGRRRRRGRHRVLQVLAVVRFLDDGHRDDKWVCGDRDLRPGEKEAILGFFSVYASGKTWLRRARGRADRGTGVLAWEEITPA